MLAKCFGRSTTESKHVGREMVLSRSHCVQRIHSYFCVTGDWLTGSFSKFVANPIHEPGQEVFEGNLALN